MALVQHPQCWEELLLTTLDAQQGQKHVLRTDT